MKPTQITLSPLTGPDGREAAQAIFSRLDVAPATAKDYSRRVGVFLDFLEGEGLHPDSFRSFKNYLREKPAWSVATKNKYLATARIFLREVHRQRPDILPADLTLNVRSFTQSKKHKRPGLTQADFAKVEAVLEGLDPRRRALVALLAWQGLRQIEVCRLDVEDLDLPRKRAFVRGKGEDDREAVALHPCTGEALEGYLAASGLRSGPLFLSRDFHRGGRRLTTRGLRGIVKAVLEEAGAGGHVVHGFRHHFTTRLLQAFGGDLLTVMKFTRHRSPEMLQVYNDDLDLQKHLPTFYTAFNTSTDERNNILPQ